MTDARNRRVLRSLKPGDRIEFKRGLYSHFGIYYRDEEVIHLTGIRDDRIESNSEHLFTISGETYKKAMVKITNFFQVCNGKEACKNNKMDKYIPPLDSEDILKAALTYVDEEVPYNLLIYNCEHFAMWCRNGTAHSQQVQQAQQAAGWSIIGMLTAIVVTASGYFGFQAWGSTKKEKEEKK